MDPIVALSGVGLTLRAGPVAVQILRGVDLAIERGERVSLVGPSGSGKTTLLMLIAGLERPTQGSVRVAGFDLHRMGEDALARVRRHHIGVVFQGFHLIPTMTSRENVAVPLELMGEPAALTRAEDALARVGLGHRLNHYPGQMSGGEQQRVALARATVGEPSLILADEPTGNLDSATGSSVMELLFDLAEHRGASLLLITHDLNLASRCGRCIRISDGQIVEDETSPPA